MSVFSGDWLIVGGPGNEGPSRWEVGYVGEQTGRWSGGVHFRVTHDVMAQIVEDNAKVLNSDQLLWDEEQRKLVLISSDGPAAYVQVIEPDADGMYDAPGWTWYEVERHEVDRIVGDVEPPEPQPIDIAFCVRLQIRPDFYKEAGEPLLRDEALWARLAGELATSLPGAGAADWKLHTDPTVVFGP